MKPEVVLCLDSESARRPELIGLDGENLLAQSWLRLFCSAVEARHYLQRDATVQEVWVASSDEMDPINLAAALKKDRRARGVYLLAFEGGGSMKSRANAAGLDATLSHRDLAQRYARKKTDWMIPEIGPSPGDCGAMAEVTQRICGRVRNASESPAGIVEAAHTPAVPGKDASPLLVPEPVRPGFGQQTSQGIQSTGDEVRVSAASSAASLEQRTAQKKTAQKKPAFVLTVVSACGGAGKSTIAALSAYFAQGLGNKTLLIDADMQFGDMHYLTGVEEPLTIEDVAVDPSRADRLQPSGMLPALLGAPKRLERSEVVAGSLVKIVEDVSDSFDVIVINTASYWAEQHAQLLERSSCVLFLIDQRPSSLRASRHALELCTRCGIATTPFVFAINRCSRSSMFSSLDVACALGSSQTVELKDGGKEVDELLGAGQPLELIGVRNDLCVSLEHALVKLLPHGANKDSRAAESVTPQAKRFRLGRRKKGVAACL